MSSIVTATIADLNTRLKRVERENAELAAEIRVAIAAYGYTLQLQRVWVPESCMCGC